MLYIAFVCIFLSIFLFTYNKNHLSKKICDQVALHNDANPTDNIQIFSQLLNYAKNKHLPTKTVNIIKRNTTNRNGSQDPY